MGVGEYGGVGVGQMRACSPDRRLQFGFILSNSDLEIGKIRRGRCPWGAHCSREDSQVSNLKKKKKVRSLVRFTWEQMGGLLSPSTEGGDF